MASDISFNKDLDKITERDMVYDIVERLRLGKDFYFEDIDHPSALAGEYLLSLFKYLGKTIPKKVLDNIENIKIASIVLNAGATTASVRINGATRVLSAYSDVNNFDYTEVINTTTSSGALVCSITNNKPSTRGEIIKIYAL